jgi:hypothetical protein
LLNALSNENRIAIGNFTFTETPLKLGHLKVEKFKAEYFIFSINLVLALSLGQSLSSGSQKCSC